MFTVLVLQFLLPVGLLLWLAVAPAVGRAAFALHAASTAAVLLALALVPMWIVPPWPAPWAYGFAFVLIIAWRMPTVLRQANRGGGHAARHRVALAALVLLGAFGAYVSAMAVLGRTQPPGPVADIGLPFADGQYLVASGGANRWVNAHLRTLDERVPRYHAWRGQSHAVDLIKVDAVGRRGNELRPLRLERYLGFGAPVLAPCSGTVVFVVDGLPDQAIGQRDTVNKAGNLVMIDCGDFVVALAHLQRGSIGVRVGERIERGVVLGRMGNSGQSDEPHLHIHAQRGLGREHPFDAEPLPLRIDGRFPVRNDVLEFNDPGADR